MSTVEADIVRGDWVDPDAGKITFGEYANWWIEQRPVRPRTKQNYEGQLMHITPGASAEQMIERPLLTWDDVRALAGAIHPRFECLIWTAAAPGLRLGELAGLSVGHVNLDTGLGVDDQARC